MNHFRLSFLFVGTIATLAGDQLTLTNGHHVTGSFLDGNSRSIRFVTGSTVTTYAAGDVFAIRFGDAADQPSSPASGNILPAGLALTVKFQAPVDSKRDAVGTDYRGTLVYGLPTGQAPLVPPGADVGLRLVNDDASGPINGRNVLTMTIVRYYGQWEALQRLDGAHGQTQFAASRKVDVLERHSSRSCSRDRRASPCSRPNHPQVYPP